ncbi:S-adenosyl-L-methionine-dependent methyltransferase [Globomyces pollinis-pini]|nr:S-adenosyl-L-methionine-dependent methyltransferase [Globomyces pollinis-pini]
MNEWDGFAKTYSSTLGLATKPFSIDILKSITINKNDTILDVACGSGTIQTALVDFINDGLISKQVKMIAIDNSGQMIQEVEELRSKYPVLDPIMTTQCIDGELLKEIADESIDIVTSSLGVILFKNRNKGFRNIFRVLKPSGQFVFSKWESTPKDIGMGIIDLTYFIFDLFPGQEEAAMKRRQLLNNDGKPVDEIRMKKSLKTIGK